MNHAQFSVSPDIHADATEIEPAMPTTETDRPMQVIVFTSQKGGSGKTTLCGQLAVQAETAGFGPTALIDTDPQGSLSDWWNAREEDWPLFVKTRVDRLLEDLEEMRMMGIQTVFIDTPPTVNDTVRETVSIADLVVVPIRPSPHDLRAVGPTLDIIDGLGKPLVFAINGATRRARITGDVAIALSQHGTVAPSTLHHRVDFATSMITGKTVMETSPQSKSTEELTGLWSYLAHRLAKLDHPGANATFETPAMKTQTPPSLTETPAPRAPRAPHTSGHLSFGKRHAPPAFGRKVTTSEGKKPE